MFLESIPGMDKIFETDIPKGMVILVIGGPGTLKSAFVFNVLSEYLKESKKEFGSYITLEETKTSHLRNMQSLNIKIQKRLKISDFATLRNQIGYDEMDYFNMIKARALKKAKFSNKKQDEKDFEYDSSSKKKKGKKGAADKSDSLTAPSCFALDSLNALYSLMNIEAKEIRYEMLKLFHTLRDNNMISFILLETSPKEIYHDEYFLVDGIIELGIIESQGVKKRYIKINKMRATRHRLEPFLLEIRPTGIRVVGELQP
jgi:KaiC/GvpD/RAD55 family RecA-like ATPase